jgi:hypothetical protein
MQLAEEIIRIRNGLYKPVPIPGVRNDKGKPIYMFVRIGEVD